MVYYRLYYFSPRTHGIVRFEELIAADDGAARALAESRQGEYALELWSGHRKVAQVEATDLGSRLIATRREENVTAGQTPWSDSSPMAKASRS